MKKINVELLIGKVHEYFDTTADYNKRTWEIKGRGDWRHFERNFYVGYEWLRDICEILNIDMDKLYLIAKSIRKWNEKRNWQDCFPYENHADEIIKYITKSDKNIETFEQKWSWLQPTLQRHIENKLNKIAV